MSIVEVKVPKLGESLDVVEITQWFVEDGDIVNRDDIIGEIDSDKASVEIPSEASGKIKILLEPGEVKIDDVMYSIDTSIEVNKPSVEANIDEEGNYSGPESLEVPLRELQEAFAKIDYESYQEVYFIKDGKIKRDWIKEGKFLFTEGSDMLFDSSLEARKYIVENITHTK